MRLGKRKEKEKDHSELKSHGAEGITRLICLSKGQNPLKGKNQSFIYYYIYFFMYLTSQHLIHIIN